MQVNQGDATPLTPQEQASLAQLTALIERVTRDGRLSRQEWQDIRAKVCEDGRVSPPELELTNQLMEQVNQGIILLED
ncbi:hypothetical protein GlitD10_1168 [Gloeomargarita lithophora Alchichica-D10]|uniref:Uncharacterized protein n=1 Tax=Gloeomargarita lithophora Alchichica-D10 TaxID=1188229 RepID=A0A1J0AC39_9CYAN|nr:hypothetical protein [Gloeomargarita lithophora]APB33488.1 hypothetical protein GlitD10_1168 [Gloeomargarita lithophora Alchichica-D10]